MSVEFIPRFYSIEDLKKIDAASFLFVFFFSFREFCFFFYLFQFEIRFGVYLVGVSCIADGDKVCARKAKAIGRRREIKSRCSREFSVISAAGLFAHLSPTLRSRYNSVGALLIALPCATPVFPRRHVFLIGKTDPLRISVWEILCSCVLLPFSHFQFNILRNVYSFSIFLSLLHELQHVYSLLCIGLNTYVTLFGRLHQIFNNNNNVHLQLIYNESAQFL